METAVQIDFQGTDPTDWIRSRIDGHLERMEKRYGRITSGRIVVTRSHRFRTGGLFEVNIHLLLPQGREVTVARNPPGDERFTDINFAINDAFRRAERQLRAHAQRLRGEVKAHPEEPLATVVQIDGSGEFGFLETRDGREVYFHRNSVLDGFEQVKVGTRVAYAEEQGDKGPQASTVKLLGKHSMR